MATLIRLILDDVSDRRMVRSLLMRLSIIARIKHGTPALSQTIFVGDLSCRTSHLNRDFLRKYQDSVDPY
jgi:hypothetical protein